MKSVNNFKQQLIDIKDNGWKIPKEENNYDLALKLMDNIGTTDSELRDMLITELLFKMIVENDLTDEEVKKLLEIALSEEHLFYNIGAKEDDSVFNRTFTALILVAIINRHNKSEKGIFTKQDIERICRDILRYAREEKDLRGYVETKGWAHSAAHTADVLSQIAQCKEIDKLELVEILKVIKEKICTNDYAYINSEDERLINAVINVIERKILNNEEIVNWIKSFEDINKTGQYPDDHYLISNQKGFLSALYFRFKRRNQPKEFLDTVEEVINKTTPDIFK